MGKSTKLPMNYGVPGPPVDVHLSKRLPRSSVSGERVKIPVACLIRPIVTPPILVHRIKAHVCSSKRPHQACAVRKWQYTRNVEHARASLISSHVDTVALPLEILHGHKSIPFHSAHRRWIAEFVLLDVCFGGLGGDSVSRGTGNRLSTLLFLIHWTYKPFHL